MKKIILVVVTFCACLTACGGTKENYALVETAYDNLRSKDEILVDSSQIEHVVVHDKDVTEIVITLNQKALDEMRNTAILLGEEAINNLINMGASDDAINAQKEHNLLLERTTYHNDERKYYIDENGVLIKYIRTVMLEQPNMENELEEEQINITISINK